MNAMMKRRTPEGELASKLKSIERDLGKTVTKKVKIVERNGIQLQRLLTKADPWAGGKCGRQTCTVCSQEDPKTPRCRQANITYRTSCKLCTSGGTRSCYIGERSRSLGERINEHTSDCDKDLEGSHMASTLKQEHPGA